MRNNHFIILFLLSVSVTFISCYNNDTKETVNKITRLNIPHNTKNDTIENPSFTKVEELINSSIKDSAFPGAVLLVWEKGKIIFEKSFGHLTYNDNSARVATNTIYDLASLTKVIATTTAAMICVDRKLFKINDNVSRYIPEFAQNGKSNIIIENLLLHNSGLPCL